MEALFWVGIALLMVLLLSSVVGLFVIGYDLFEGHILIGQDIYLSYFFYAISAVVFLHFAFFLLNHFVKGKAVQRRIPRYIEYAYAIVISSALAQIFISGPRIVDYVRMVSGGEDVIAQRIFEMARGYQADECQNHNYPPLIALK